MKQIQNQIKINDHVEFYHEKQKLVGKVIYLDLVPDNNGIKYATILCIHNGEEVNYIKPIHEVEILFRGV